MKKNTIQNRRIKDDMHYTKGIENKNYGIEEKRFTNCKKDRMEKKYKKKQKNSKAGSNGLLGFGHRNILSVFKTVEFPI